MSEAKKTSLNWPVCTILILALAGGILYWGYTAFQAEQAMTEAKIAAPAKTWGSGPAPVAYRSALPPYFLVGFALVMAGIMGTIIYFWWSLKDMEGGRNDDTEDEEVPPPD